MEDQKIPDFGDIVEIEIFQHHSENKFHQFKVIGRFQSNGWVDVPMKYPMKKEWHPEMSDVINVVECGVVEETVQRVRIKDVKFLKTHQSNPDETSIIKLRIKNQ